MTDFTQHAKRVRRISIGRKRAAVAAAIAASALGAIPVLATPGSGFAPTNLSSVLFGQQHAGANKPGVWGIQLQTQGRTLVGVDKVTVAAGGQSGWHTHAGLVMISVTSGSLLWTDGDTCQTRLYNAGDGFIEPANHVHLVRNASASQGAEFTGVQLRPEGTPGRIDASAPSNNCGL
ncbi:MAG TPA: cupin domain-containing protein [Croceibacterium sp.]|nr:cupin domain-containing protein [Croceibacterium sp.]